MRDINFTAAIAQSVLKDLSEEEGEEKFLALAAEKRQELGESSNHVVWLQLQGVAGRCPWLLPHLSEMFEE